MVQSPKRFLGPTALAMVASLSCQSFHVLRCGDGVCDYREEEIACGFVDCHDAATPDHATIPDDVIVAGDAGEPIDLGPSSDVGVVIDVPIPADRGSVVDVPVVRDVPASVDSGQAIAPGQACTRSSDCPGPNGLCLPPENGWVGGMCTYPCPGSNDCGPNGYCLRWNGLPGYMCLQACTSSAQCRSGYSCLPASTGGAPAFCSIGCPPDGGVPPPAVAISCTADLSVCHQTSCRLQCRNDGDCGTHLRCDTMSQSCVCADDQGCGAEFRCDVPTGRCIARM